MNLQILVVLTNFFLFYVYYPFFKKQILSSCRLQILKQVSGLKKETSKLVGESWVLLLRFIADLFLSRVEKIKQDNAQFNLQHFISVECMSPLSIKSDIIYILAICYGKLYLKLSGGNTPVYGLYILLYVFLFNKGCCVGADQWIIHKKFGSLTRKKKVLIV